MKLTVCIDWQNWTADYSADKLPREYTIPLECEYKPGKPSNGYTNAVENALGTRIQWHHSRRDMGVHVQYSGATINAHAANGITAKDIAAFHYENSDRCGRIDIAIDVIDSNVSITALYREIEEGYNLPFSRKASHIKSTDGETLYVGSRTSEQFLRIYDKAAEQKTDDNWKRVELELKGSRAMFTAVMLINEGEVATGEVARKLVKAMADFETATWQKIVGSEPMTIGKSDNREPDTKEWLIASVAPAMGRYIAKSGDANLIEQFLAVVAAFAGNDPTEHLSKVREVRKANERSE